LLKSPLELFNDRPINQLASRFFCKHEASLEILFGFGFLALFLRGASRLKSPRLQTRSRRVQRSGKRRQGASYQIRQIIEKIYGFCFAASFSFSAFTAS
jgi:hypothetical protein